MGTNKLGIIVGIAIFLAVVIYFGRKKMKRVLIKVNDEKDIRFINDAGKIILRDGLRYEQHR